MKKARSCLLDYLFHFFQAMTAMVQTQQRGSNSLLWWGLIITVLGFLSNFLYWLPVPQGVIPWINLFVPLIGLVLLALGLLRSWSGASLWFKGLGVFLGLLCAVVLTFSVWIFIDARNVPRSAGAPQVGQKVPDFTLPDSTGQPVSLSLMLASPVATSTRPKALLLVFYRGYW